MPGFGDPPKHTQFKPGQSGNPKGRPKKEKPTPPDTPTKLSDADAFVLQEAERLIDVQEGDERRKMQMVRVVLRARSKSAAKGNAYAQRDFLRDYEKAERARRRAIKEDCEFWTWCIEARKFKDDAARARGEMPKYMLPLPEDVVIDWERGVRFEGPCFSDTDQIHKDSARIRDVLVMQAARDERHPTYSDKKEGDIGFAMLLVHQFESLLARRYRLPDSEFVGRLMEYGATPKRVLLRTLYQGWRAVGIPIRRGVVFPLLRKDELQTALLRVKRNMAAE